MSRGTFIRRVDSTSFADLSSRDMRLRIELLEAELEQLEHDAGHVSTDTYGLERVRHLHNIERERSAALERKTRLLEELGKRT